MPKEGYTEMQIKNVPTALLRDFDLKVVEKMYPGGRSEAIRDLMRREITEAP